MLSSEGLRSSPFKRVTPPGASRPRCPVFVGRDGPDFAIYLSAGVDDAESECGLDNFGTFDWVIENHGDEQRLEEQLEHLVEFVRSRLQPAGSRSKPGAAGVRVG